MGKFEKGNKIGNRFRTNEEATEAGRQGGIASAKAKRHAKTLREAMKVILEMKHENGSTGAENIIVALYEKAITGDVQAVKLFGEMMEEYRKKVEVNDGQPFTLKVVEVAEDMQDKINGYLNGGSDGTGV